MCVVSPAGDWQGAEDGLSDVELELMLAEFAYVEQVGRGGALGEEQTFVVAVEQSMSSWPTWYMWACVRLCVSVGERVCSSSG